MRVKKARKALGVAIAAATMTTPAPRLEPPGAQYSPRFTDTLERTAKKPPERTSMKDSLDADLTIFSENQIAEFKTTAIRSLTASVPNDPALDHLRDTSQLEREATAYVPSMSERQMVLEKSQMQLQKLSAATVAGEYSLFGFADIDEQRTEQHRLYVMHKDNSGVLRFALGFRVAMAEKGFGNEEDSGQTPIGLTYIEDGYRGMYGEVVAVEKKTLPYFKIVVTGHNGRQHRFISNFGEPRIEPAAVVTARYTINGKRGIHFHGTNRTGKWVRRDGKTVWHSLLGTKGSGACGRMANTDVEILGRFVKLPTRKDGKIIVRGTPVFIHATPKVLARSQISDEDASPNESRSRPKTEKPFNPFANQY